jgi:hydrogenase expression/formation protein HypC
MCLAIPGQILETYDRGGVRMAKVRFGGIDREACVEYVPAAGVGDFVLVHVGFALSVVDPEEAQKTFALLAEMGALAELEAGEPGDAGGPGAKGQG